MNKQTEALREKIVETLYESDIDTGKIGVELVKSGTARGNYYPLADELLQACADMGMVFYQKGVIAHEVIPIDLAGPFSKDAIACIQYGNQFTVGPANEILKEE